MMRKAILTVGLFTLCCLIFNVGLASAQNKLRVGVVVDLSGFGAVWGQSIKNGTQMALEDISPELRQEIELIFEDDQFSAKNDATAL